MGVTETSPTMSSGTGSSPSGNTSKLTVDVFNDIFKCLEPEIEIVSFEEEQGSGRGDNYTATLYRIHLWGQRRSLPRGVDPNAEKWEKYVICKRLPENFQLREAYKSEQLFRNEVEFYVTIMPELLKFQATKTDQIFKAIPECYFARSDILIMEDLRIRGFQMPDRKQGLTIDETNAVLRQVAHFHALSLSYKFERRKQFESLRKITNEGLFSVGNESWYRNYYEILTTNAIQMVSEVLPPDSKYLKAFREFAKSTTFFGRMVNLVSEDSTLTALCHGDCWANNFLYRYKCNVPPVATNNGDDETKTMEVVEVCLVDFQLIRYSSIALDVANLLFCCTSKSLRDQYLSQFIDLYVREHFKWLQLLCTRIPEHCNTLDKFQKMLFLEELKCYGRFALGLALDIIPISTCSSEDAPDMYNLNRSETTTTTTTRSNPASVRGAPVLNLPPNDLCRQKMSEIVIDMVDNGML